MRCHIQHNPRCWADGMSEIAPVTPNHPPPGLDCLVCVYGCNSIGPHILAELRLRRLHDRPPAREPNKELLHEHGKSAHRAMFAVASAMAPATRQAFTDFP